MELTLNNLSGDARGCGGSRTRGDIYAVNKLGIGGIPIDWTLLCPVWQEDPAKLGLSPQGMVAQPGRGDRSDKTDVYDWVGKSLYPCVPLFDKEGRTIGYSRKFPETFPFNLLDNGSLHWLGHPYAGLLNYEAFYKNRVGVKMCPKHIEEHDDNSAEEACIGLLWEAVGDVDESRELKNMPFPPGAWPPTFSLDYVSPIVKPKFTFAFFQVLSIDKFEIINDNVDGKHEKRAKILETSGTDIPFEVVEK